MPRTKNDGEAIELRLPRHADRADEIDVPTHRPPVEAEAADDRDGTGPSGPPGRPIRRRGPRPGGTPA